MSEKNDFFSKYFRLILFLAVVVFCRERRKQF